MKLKTASEGLSSKTRSRFAAVAVMAAGLSIMPCCASREATMPVAGSEDARPAAVLTPAISRQSSSAADRAAGDVDYQRMLVSRVREAARQAGIPESDISSIPNIVTRQEVSVGSPVTGGIFDNTAVPFRVTAIDNAGVEIEGMDRLEFGRPRIIGEFILQSLSVAEPGPNGTAIIITVTPSVYTEMKRTTPDKMRPSASAVPYQTSGPVQK